eukprot:COSAG01_NODE_3739_length_5746_cov_4.418984_5_plen_205_part_00
MKLTDGGSRRAPIIVAKIAAQIAPLALPQAPQTPPDVQLALLLVTSSGSGSHHKDPYGDVQAAGGRQAAALAIRILMVQAVLQEAARSRRSRRQEAGVTADSTDQSARRRQHAGGGRQDSGSSVRDTHRISEQEQQAVIQIPAGLAGQPARRRFRIGGPWVPSCVQMHFQRKTPSPSPFPWLSQRCTLQHVCGPTFPPGGEVFS